MSDAAVITELVEVRLLGRWRDFLPVFEAQFLPILLAAPGILSVRTGTPLSSAVDYERGRT